MALVESPVGAVTSPEAQSAEAPEAHPELASWQAARWAPHGDLNVPAPVSGMFEHTRGDGSFHDLTLEQAEKKAAEAAYSKAQRKGRK